MSFKQEKDFRLEDTNDQILRPYKETLIEETDETRTFLRTFSSSTHSDDFVWHRDRYTRIVQVEELTGDGWYIQLDDSLPLELTVDPNKVSEITIPQEVWHRLIPGTGEIRLRVVEFSH
jgi:hypothetical protein